MQPTYNTQFKKGHKYYSHNYTRKVIIVCEVCSNEFVDFISNKRKYCSRICFNKTIGEKTSRAMKGVKRGVNLLLKGERNPNWKGGISPANRLFRRSLPYKEWRMSVFKRDYFTCVNCGYRSRKSKDIRADHIKPFSLYPELRLDIDNGRTLCVPCDLRIGWNYMRDHWEGVQSATNL